MNKRKWVTLAAAAAMTAVMGSTAFAAPSDISGHWAQSAINSWTSMGYISGYPDGTFKPDNQISRAEFVVLVNKAMRFSIKANSSFNDVSSDHWAHDEIMKAVAAGYISGDGNGTFRPNDPVRRQEAAVMIAKVKSLGVDNNGIAAYTDSGKIPTWASGYIGSVSRAGIMSGYPNGEFKAGNTLTRAEAVVALNKAMNYVKPSTPVVQQPTVQPSQPSTPTTSVDDYTLSSSSLKDRVVNGDLTISSSMSNRSVTLDNVTVYGRLIVNGGGTITADDCDIFMLEMDKTDATFKTTGTTTVNKTTFERAGKIQGKGFDTVTVDNKLSADVTIDAEVKSLELDAETDLRLLSDADIRSFDVTNNADRATVNFNSAEVRTMDVHDKIRITGRGDIGTMNVYTSGISSTIKPDTVNRYNGASNPSYTSNSSGSVNSSGSSRYDDYTARKDNARLRNEKYDDLTIRADGVRVYDSTIYGNLTIDDDVEDGDAYFEDVTVRGNVYVYGGGDNSVVFDDCDIRGNVIVNKGNKELVHVDFRGTTEVDGYIRVLGKGAILESDEKLDEVTMAESGVELELKANVGTLTISKKGELRVRSGYTVDRVTVSSNADNTYISVDTNATIKNLSTSSKIDVSGSGTVANTSTSGSGNINSSGGINEGVAVTGIKLNKDTLSLKPTAAETLTATVEPSNATDKTVSWNSSNKAVATVSDNGRVLAIANGEAKITATAGGKTATCTVTVSATGGNGSPDDPSKPENPGEDTIEITGTTFDKETKTLTLNKATMDNPTASLTAKVNGLSTTASGITWKIENKDANQTANVGSLSHTTGNNVTVTGVNVGEATITATYTNTSTNKSVSTTCNLKVIDEKTPIPVTNVSITPAKVDITNGGKATLTANITNADATLKAGDVKWTSSDTNKVEITNTQFDVAKVNNAITCTAEITGKGADNDTATITVTVTDAKNVEHKATCEVTIKPAPTYVTGITLDKSTMSMQLKKNETVKQTLTATLEPATVTDNSVIWSITEQNPETVGTSVVSLPQTQTNGSSIEITALNPGTATIKAVASGSQGTTVDDKLNATCVITVIKDESAITHVSGISLSPTELTLSYDTINGGTSDPKPIEVIFTEPVPDNKKVTWSVSPSDGITISPTTTDGNRAKVQVRATKFNSAADANNTYTITATTEDKIPGSNGTEGSPATATCTVTVEKKAIVASSVKVTDTTNDRVVANPADKNFSAGITMTAGTTIALSGEVQPSDADNKNISWLIHESGNNYISLSAQSGNTTTVRAVDVGTGAKIVARVGTSDTDIPITVNSNVTNITVNPASTNASVYDGTIALTATLTPPDAKGNITWTSTNSNIATVSGTGTSANVTLTGNAGEVTIRASVDGTSVSGTCTITVTDEITSFVLSAPTSTLAIGSTHTLTATPNLTTWNNKIEWTSSNPSIVSVSGNGATGTITPHAVGSATITAKLGTHEATCVVTVTAAQTSGIGGGGTATP